MQDIAKAIGIAIRNRRVEASLTQEQLAERSGLHWTYVSQIERGERNPSADVLVRIGRALGVTGWELLREAEAANATQI